MNIFEKQWILTTTKDIKSNYTTKQWKFKYNNSIQCDWIEKEINGFSKIYEEDHDWTIKFNFINSKGEKVFLKDIELVDDILGLVNWISLIQKNDNSINFTTYNWKEILKEPSYDFLLGNSYDKFFDNLNSYPKSSIYIKDINKILIKTIAWEEIIETNFLLNNNMIIEWFINEYSIITNWINEKNIVSIYWKLLFKNWIHCKKIWIFTNWIAEIEYHDWSSWYINENWEID